MLHRVSTRAATVVVACVLLAGCGASTGGGLPAAGNSSRTNAGSVVGVTVYEVGQRPTIPDLSGATLDGGALALSSFHGHVVVLNVWASWCEPCRSESPTLARIARDTAASGVRFVGVDEQDRADPARAFAASAGTTYPHIVDGDGRLLASLRIVPSSGIPSTLVIDSTGSVAARVIGPVDAATFEGVVKAVVGTGSAPS